MLSETDLTVIQQLILREIQLVAAKIQDHDKDPDSEARRAAKLLGHFANERLGEVVKGDLNRPHYNENV